MNRTLLAQNQAPVAGAARPCAHRYAWLGSASGVGIPMNTHDVTKFSTRRLGRQPT